MAPHRALEDLRRDHHQVAVAMVALGWPLADGEAIPETLLGELRKRLGIAALADLALD